MIKVFEKLMVFLCCGLIYCYKFFISSVVLPSCRFTPTCSAYAIDALKNHGLCSGFILIAKRLLRCHPWSFDGEDPAPQCKVSTKIKGKK